MEGSSIFPDIYIPKEEACFFRAQVHRKVLNQGEYFVERNSCCDTLGLIDSGLLGLVVARGHEQLVLSRYMENELVTVFGSFLSGENTPWGIIALRPSSLTIIPNQLLSTLFERHACWVQFWMKAMETQIRRLTEIEDSLLAGNITLSIR